MKRFSTVFTAVAAVVSAIVLAGCGEVSKAEYTKNMQSALKPLNAQFKQLNNPTSSAMKSTGVKMQQVADDIDHVDAPSDVQPLHDRLVKDLHTLGTLIVKLAPEMDKLNKDPSAFAQVQQDMPGITEKFQKTSNDLDAVMKSYAKHGYEFSKLSGITG